MTSRRRMPSLLIGIHWNLCTEGLHFTSEHSDNPAPWFLRRGHKLSRQIKHPEVLCQFTPTTRNPSAIRP